MDAAGYGVNRHRREIGKQLVPQQSGFPWKDRVLVKTGLNAFERESADLDGRVCHRGGNRPQADGKLPCALCRIRPGRYPFQGFGAACVLSHPLLRGIDSGDRHAHSARPDIHR